jgi:uncharacterized protein (DUF362 family)
MIRKPAVVAISHTKEKHRSIERVTELTREALSHLGGLSRFVRRGQTVLLKPNQTVFYSSEEGCTTDPLLVGALIRLLKEAGATRIQVGESSGGYFDSIECMSITGVAAIAEAEGAELINLGSDSVPNRTVRVPLGRIIKEVPLPSPLLDADVIINVPKAKTHHYEPISGALKNWMGAVNQNWRLENHGDDDAIPRFVDVMSVRPPTLNVVDALIAGEGDGPIANQPHWCGCILASDDPVATDVSIARLLGQDWKKLKFAEEAESRGLGVRDPIEYKGRPVEEVAIEAWKGHEGFDYLPVNFLVGGKVSLAGTVGHVKSVLDSMLRRGELNKVLWMKGTPTIMIGDVDDPMFEEHIKEGPYIVFDDSARPEYKSDPRVYFVPGHPVLRTAMPELMKGLGVSLPGNAIMKWQQFEQWGMHNLEYGSRTRKLLTVTKPVLFAGLAVAGVGAISALIKKLASPGKHEE